MFNISFTPVEYGKIKIGKLVIETSEMYWSFCVKGTFPPYKVPDSITCKIDNWRKSSDEGDKIDNKMEKTDKVVEYKPGKL